MSHPVIPDQLRDEAVHGSFCPKLCNFACPVVAATGREDATPWSFHRTVADVATGRREVTLGDAHQLRGCTGCLACRTACEPDLDVPAQVVAGRAAARAAGVEQPEVQTALDHVAAGRTPFGSAAQTTGEGDAAGPEVDVTVLAGCRDGTARVAALDRLLDAAGVSSRVVVPDGCCGGVLAELGATEEARAAGDRTREELGGDVIALDPHCVPAVTAEGTTVTDPASYLAALLEEGRLALAPPARPTRVAYHDPCLTARRDGVLAPPRSLLAAAGWEVVEPEGHGAHTVCSGAGLAADLLAPDDAAGVADLRARQLAATGAPVATGCAGAERRLADAGVDVTDLLVLLASRLPEEDA